MMTLEQFRSARRLVDDIQTELNVDLGAGKEVPGYIYPGPTYIELDEDTGRWCLMLYSEGAVSDDIEPLEHRLYDFAVAEGFLN